MGSDLFMSFCQIALRQYRHEFQLHLSSDIRLELNTIRKTCCFKTFHSLLDYVCKLINQAYKIKEKRKMADEEVVTEEKKDGFFKKAFKDMHESAKAQHEVDKANFEASKAEAKTNFEENRFSNTYKNAKENSRKSWDDAHMSNEERKEKMNEKQQTQIKAANERKKTAEDRYEAVKVR